MNNQRQHARAPYNFVPLPERAVDVREQPGIMTLDDALPSHNIFRSDRRHGYFDITLTTESPLYIRGMLTREEAENKEAYRNKPDFFHPGDSNSPVIPGSSLRGMIRSLLEIVTWSKLTRVSDSPKIFYRAVAAKKDDPRRMVQYFGHAPFSRIQATLTEGGKTRALTPLDLVPNSLREQADHIDFAEAVFGYVRPEKRGQGKQGDKERAYAGRVSVSDAKMVTQTDDPYDIDAEGITPKILGSPKPTTFQHYLEQPNRKSTQKQDLHHYGKDGAKIRGHKLYWRQRINTVPTDPNASRDSKQHTRMRPIKRGIQFKFRVDFENLTDIELGALAWVLALGSANHHPNARHMLGMGKPFGMGVVKLDATLALRNREQRYASLFSDTGWSSGDAVANVDTFIPQFIEFISTAVGEGYPSRMQELLTMLEGREPNPLFTYMQIEPNNEYKDRPVLPYPTEVVPSPEMLAQQEQEHLRQEEEQRRLQEAQRLKADKVARKDMIGDEIKGKVFDVTSKGDIWFTFRWSDGEEYEGVIPHDKVIKKRGENNKIKARIIEQQVTRNGRIEVICEQIVESK